MVCSRNPQCIISFHSFIADQNILQCIVKRVAHMKFSGNVRRRHHRCKRFSAPVNLSVKIFVFTPLLIQFFFDRFRIICLCQFFAHSFFLSLLSLIFPIRQSPEALNTSRDRKQPPLEQNGTPSFLTYKGRSTLRAAYTKNTLYICKGRILRGTTLFYIYCHTTYISQVL